MTEPLPAPTSESDTKRLDRLISLLELRVARDSEGDWTCWLELPCIPTRSKTTDVREFIDCFAHFDKTVPPLSTEAPK